MLCAVCRSQGNEEVMKVRGCFRGVRMRLRPKSTPRYAEGQEKRKKEIESENCPQSISAREYDAVVINAQAYVINVLYLLCLCIQTGIFHVELQTISDIPQFSVRTCLFILTIHPLPPPPRPTSRPVGGTPVPRAPARENIMTKQ